MLVAVISRIQRAAAEPAVFGAGAAAAGGEAAKADTSRVARVQDLVAKGGGALTSVPKIPTKTSAARPAAVDAVEPLHTYRSVRKAVLREGFDMDSPKCTENDGVLVAPALAKPGGAPATRGALRVSFRTSQIRRPKRIR